MNWPKLKHMSHKLRRPPAAQSQPRLRLEPRRARQRAPQKRKLLHRRMAKPAKPRRVRPVAGKHAQARRKPRLSTTIGRDFSVVDHALSLCHNEENLWERAWSCGISKHLRETRSS